MIRTPWLKIKIQIMCDDLGAMGPGKADLLEAIDREGSISGAGRALGMSYRRSWLLVDAMNRCWRERLVETNAGGGKDRGAKLTSTGREVLAGFRALEQRLEKQSRNEVAALVALMRDKPLPEAQHGIRDASRKPPSAD